MLVEVKAKVSRIINGKTKRRTETYIIPDCELFVNAEHTVMQKWAEEQELGLVECSEILSLKQSPIKEICEDTMPGSAFPFIVTLKDLFHDDNGNEKSLRYQVLLWANDLSQANQRTQQLARQGYDMQVEGLKQVDYEYIQRQ